MVQTIIAKERNGAIKTESRKTKGSTFNSVINLSIMINLLQLNR
jgi:hypothetical protein